MRHHDTLRLAVALALATLLSGGCAAKWAHRKGNEAAELGDWDLAVAHYTKAADEDPKNVGYKISLENARIQASRYHYDKAKEHLAAKDLERAAEELEVASKYDPSNRSAADDLLLVREQIRKRDAERRERDEYGEMKARAEATRVPLPVLSPRSPMPITIKFQDASLEKIFDSLGRIAGVNILFDNSFKDMKTSVSLTGVTFEEALEQLTFVNRLFYKVLDQNTLIVVPEARQKRVIYNELALRTFYLENAELNDTVNLIKTLAKLTTVVGNASLRAVTVVGTPDQLAIAERIIALNDKARGEVIVEVKILEVSKNATRNWGLNLSKYAAALVFDPTGVAPAGEGEGGTTNTDFNGLISLRAQFLSSLSRADWVVAVPEYLFAQFLQTEGTVRILSAPRLRAAEGKKAELRVGTEVPIPVTTFAATTGGTGTYTPATSFQYKNVGVNLSITPQISASGDITLEVQAEFSLLGEDRAVTGGGDDALKVPTFLTRNVSNVLRLRDGETALIGGLVEGSQTRSISGAVGVSSIPIIGDLFTYHKSGQDDKEVIISLTPRIVRAPKVTEDDLIPMPVGTQEVPRVKGASPGLFAPWPGPEGATAESAPAEESGAPATGTSPAEREASRPEPSEGEEAEPPAAVGPGPEPPAEPGPDLGPVPPGEAEPALPPEALVGPEPGPPTVAPTTPPPPEEAGAVNVLLSPPEVVVRAGETAGVSVVLVGAQDLEWVEIAVAWDPLLVDLAEVNAGSLLTLDGAPVAVARTLEEGRARVRFTRSTAASGSGAVAALTLRALRPGSGVLTVESVAAGPAGAMAPLPAPPPGRVVVAERVEEGE